MGEFAPVTRAFEGRGIMKFKTGDIYEGKWENGLMHGHGTLIYGKIFDDESSEEEDEDGAEGGKGQKFNVTANYVGDFVEGRRTEGTLTYDNGDVFTGVFNEKGIRESGSIKFAASGDEFAGLFEEGAMKCGIMNFANGDVYSGEFENSLFHGGGKMTYKNGDEYAGEFENGVK